LIHRYILSTMTLSTDVGFFVYPPEDIAMPFDTSRGNHSAARSGVLVGDHDTGTRLKAAGAAANLEAVVVALLHDLRPAEVDLKRRHSAASQLPGLIKDGRLGRRRTCKIGTKDTSCCWSQVEPASSDCAAESCSRRQLRLSGSPIVVGQSWMPGLLLLLYRVLQGE